MEIKSLSPFILPSLLFAAVWAIKAIAFQKTLAWLDLGPAMGLWSTSVLFTIAVSEQTQFRGKLAHRVSRIKSERSLRVDYDVVLPSQLSFTPKYLYYLVFSVVLLVLNVLLWGCVERTLAGLSPDPVIAGLCAAGSFGLGGLAFGTAVRCNLEAM